MKGNLIARLRRELNPWVRQDVSVSYDLYNEVRARHGLRPVQRLSAVLSKPNGSVGNKKLGKTASYREAAVGGRTLAQGDTSGYEVCPWKGVCFKACLGNEGNFRYKRNTVVKIARTQFEYEHPHHAWSIYAHEVQKDLAWAEKRGYDLFWRPDVLSDTSLWRVLPEFFDLFPTVGFYGYTKNWASMNYGDRGWMLPNYRLALSADERVHLPIHEALSDGWNVAMVFDVQGPSELPIEWEGWPVVDATQDDTWMLTHSGVVGGLEPIGWRMKADTSGFVRQAEGERHGEPDRVARTVLVSASAGVQ